MWIKREYIYVICLILFVLFISNLLIQKDVNIYGGYDKEYYFSMASNPSSDLNLNHHAPFAYRIALPYLTFGLNKLVNNLDLSFKILTGLFLALTMFFLFYYLFKIKKIGYKKSLLGILVFAFIPYLLFFNLYDFYLVDAMLYLFIILFFIVLESNYKFRNLWIFILITFGTLVKEFMLVFIPVYFFYEFSKKKEKILKLLSNTFFIGIGGIFAFILLRILIFVIDAKSYLLSTFTGIVGKFISLNNNPILYAYLSLSLLWIFIFANFKRSKEYLSKGHILIYFIITVILGILVNDFHRVFVYLFPVLIPLIVLNISDLRDKSKNWKYIIIGIFILQLILLILRYTIGYSFGFSLIWPNTLFLVLEFICLLITIILSIYFIVKHIKSK